MIEINSLDISIEGGYWYIKKLAYLPKAIVDIDIEVHEKVFTLINHGNGKFTAWRYPTRLGHDSQDSH